MLMRKVQIVFTKKNKNSKIFNMKKVITYFVKYSPAITSCIMEYGRYTLL